MLKCQLEVFVVPAATPTGALPPGPPTTRELQAKTDDGLLEAARQLLEAEGYRLRALSFGPSGLVAYVEEQR